MRTEPTAYCRTMPAEDHTGCPSSIECHHVTAAPVTRLPQMAPSTKAARTSIDAFLASA